MYQNCLGKTWQHGAVTFLLINDFKTSAPVVLVTGPAAGGVSVIQSFFLTLHRHFSGPFASEALSDKTKSIVALVLISWSPHEGVKVVATFSVHQSREHKQGWALHHALVRSCSH